MIYTLNEEEKTKPNIFFRKDINHMSIIAQFQYPSKEKARIVSMYKKNHYSVCYVCTKYSISKATLMRWCKIFDGTIQSLDNKSRKPKSPHPSSHTPFEIEKILNLIKRNPRIGLTELYSKLRSQINYKRHYASLYRFLVKTGHYKKHKTVYKIYKPKKYFTPELLGEKMQLDVKFVPIDCNANLQDDYKYYQYTIIDEASRERFIYAYNEHSSFSTIDFVKRAITYFGYIPKTIQTDNGSEFTYTRENKDDITHPFDILCKELNIEHKLIRPRTPRHNGKVERSHRNDNIRFYQFLKFYNLDDLQVQMRAYLKRSNNIGMTPLNYKTPIEKRKELIMQNKVFIRS